MEIEFEKLLELKKNMIFGYIFTYSFFFSLPIFVNTKCIHSVFNSVGC